MRISLIDVDSKICNLALMKISAFHKAQGDTVGFKLQNPDKIYASIIFRRKKGFALNNRLDNVPFEIGGSGYSLDSCLPLAMEFLKPDYDLYPSEYSQGFSTRGCNRKCDFCIVWKKEGTFMTMQHPKEFYDDRFKEMMLMDNNILFDKRWTKKVLSWALDQGVKINMTQGYDIRLLDEKIAGLILESNIPMIRFAFDDSKLKSLIIEKLKLLKNVGFDLRNRTAFYVYLDDDLMFDDAVSRCNFLKNKGTMAHLMFNCDKKRTRRVKDLIKWSWRKPFYWGMTFQEFRSRCHL
jgi:hypothetical protein